LTKGKFKFNSNPPKQLESVIRYPLAPNARFFKKKNYIFCQWDFYIAKEFGRKSLVVLE
jgi:hypothetical protein